MNAPAPGRVARVVIALCALLAASVQGPAARAQRAPDLSQPDMRVDAALRRKVVGALAHQIEAGYLDAQQARRIARALRHHLEYGDDDTIATARQLADSLTTQMQHAVPDPHLFVDYSAEPLTADDPDGRSTPSQNAAELAQMKAHNFGIDDVRRLPFNIGYLRLELFLPAQDAGPALTAAMNLLADTDALIIDLRGNHGGDQNTVALVASYLFDRRTHLNDFYYPRGDRMEQMWTSEYVPGPRYGGSRKVFILTDRETASAAEDFSYDLKQLKRASIVGEPTAGAAHCGDIVRLTAHFQAMVPNCRGVNPITGTNWGGTGVVPDLKSPTRDAFAVAQMQALKDMLAVESDPARAGRIRARIAAVKAGSGDAD